MTKRFFTGALLLFLALEADAQRITRDIVDPTTGAIVPAADPGEIIIEFAAPPLLARGAKAGLDALFARLERDLAAIERRGIAAKAEGPFAPDIRHRYTRTFAGASARVQPESIESIRQLSYVRSVHPDRVVTALLFESVEQIGAPAVWQEYGARGEGVVVAIIDSGIDYNHPALGTGFGTGFKVRGGRDFVNNDADPMDDNGHGTHVAGIVAANGVGLVGVAPDASLLAYKVLDQSGSGRDSYVLAAVEEVARQMPDVVNMSLGRSAVPDDPVVRAIEIAAATGIVFSVAAGNTGKFLDIGSPGNAPSVITVGAIDKQGRLASFSSKGPVVPTGSIKPEVVAPGVQILSARNGGGERTASGTSMAAPHVAGVAALLRDIHPDWSASRIRSAIINGARPLTAEVMVAGAGKVYAADAVRKNLQPSTETLSFGISDHLQQPWTASRSVTLTNRSETAQTLTLYIEGLREGIELTPSATSIALDAGASAQLDLALSVDHTKVVSPEAGSLSYGGLLRFTAEGGSISIPWSFVKAKRVPVRWTGTGSAAVKLATERMMVAGTTTTDTQRVELFIGAGDVALWVAGEEARGSVHHVIRENVDLSSAAEITIGPADAPHRIRFAGTDVNGRLLGDRGGLSVRDVLFSHPYFSAVSLFDALAYLPSGKELFVSTLSPSTRVVAFERAFDESPAITWSAVYEPLNGVDRDVDLIIPAGSWKSLSARGIVPEGLVHPYQAIFGAIWVRTGRQSLSSIARPNIVGPPVVGDTAVDAWITSAATDETITGIVVEMGDDEDEAPLSNSELIAEFTAVDGGVVGGRDRNLRISASVIPSHQPFTIGEGPACPTSIVSSVRGVMSARIEWSGPHGEDRIHDAKRTTASLYDGIGNLIATGTPLAPSDGFVMTTPLPQAGPYLLQASTSTFQTGGSAARGTLRIAFDSSKSDPMPPALTSLRIEDGGRTTSSLKGPSAATLTFSAVDYGTSNFADLQRDRTAVHYRRHGAGDDAWTPLSATVVAEDLPASPIGLFRVPDGVLYRVQLNQMQGAIDVRIAVEDAAGNRTEYVVEPAFVVSMSKRRAVAR